MLFIDALYSAHNMSCCVFHRGSAPTRTPEEIQAKNYAAPRQDHARNLLILRIRNF